jgi:hypothetical protein
MYRCSVKPMSDFSRSLPPVPHSLCGKQALLTSGFATLISTRRYDAQARRKCARIYFLRSIELATRDLYTRLIIVEDKRVGSVEILTENTTGNGMSELREKKNYSAPVLTIHGTVEAITQCGLHSNADGQNGSRKFSCT